MLVASAAALSIGCPSRSAADARAIAAAFDAFEQASESDKHDALDSLRRARCDEPQSCADRDVCARYADAIVRASDLSAKAHELGPEDAGGNGAATPTERARIIQGAQDALEEAQSAEPKCHEALERLRAGGAKS